MKSASDANIYIYVFLFNAKFVKNKIDIFLLFGDALEPVLVSYSEIFGKSSETNDVGLLRNPSIIIIVSNGVYQFGVFIVDNLLQLKIRDQSSNITKNKYNFEKQRLWIEE